jgi:hypothetical protein
MQDLKGGFSMKLAVVPKTSVFDTGSRVSNRGSQLGAVDAMALRCAMASLEMLKDAAAVAGVEVGELTEEMVIAYLARSEHG